MPISPCPICQTPASQREQLKDGMELCNGCGFAIRLDDDGRLTEFATTSKSHPKGIWEEPGPRSLRVSASH